MTVVIWLMTTTGKKFVKLGHVMIQFATILTYDHNGTGSIMVISWGLTEHCFGEDSLLWINTDEFDFRWFSGLVLRIASVMCFGCAKTKSIKDLNGRSFEWLWISVIWVPASSYAVFIQETKWLDSFLTDLRKLKDTCWKWWGQSR